jgi:hypothetical protein
MPTASSRTTASRSSWPGPELQALAEAALALARRAPSGRIALARTEEIFGRTTVHEPLDATTVQRATRRLDDVDPEPLAVRAAAQTHRGVVDGKPVAIRIRRPGLERMARNDLALLDALALPLSAALPRVDAAVLLRSAREQLLDELDFEHEASMHRRIARILRDVDGLVVPSVHSDLCDEDVFVADLLDTGRAKPKDAARVLVAAHVAAARAGLALLDSRPGHVLGLADGRLGLLGAGVARPVGRDRVTLLLDALAALRADDEAAFASATRDVVGPDAYRVAQSALGPLVHGEARLDEPSLRRAASALALANQANPHPDDLHLARAAAQLVATLAQVDPTADWGALVAASS